MQIKTGWRKFLHFAKFLLPYWKIEILLIVFSQLIVYLGLVNPYLSKLVIDEAYKNRNVKLFILLAILGGGIFLISGIISAFSNYYSRYIKKRVNVDISQLVVSHIHSLGLEFFKNTSHSENLYKVNYDIDRVTNLITSAIEQVLKLFPTLIFTLAIVWFLNWRMALAAFFLGIFFYIHAAYFAKRRRHIQHKLIKQNQGIFSRLNEVFSKMHLVKAAGKDKYESRVYSKGLREAMATYFKGIKMEVLSGSTSNMINKMIIGAISFYGGYQIIKENMTLGTLTAILVYLSRVAGFHNSLANLFQNVSMGLISCDRLQVILEKKKEQSEEKERIIPKDFGPNIVFEDVCFCYTPKKYVLKNFNMRILPKQWIGLAGGSGCGKSTVLNLLLGLYYPLTGRILAEGIPIQDIDLNFIRVNTAVVLQEPNLWNASIRENIVYFNAAANAGDIERVINEVMLTNTIKQQPKGLGTQLGDGACKFSEGQKQRLALARALLHRPKLLILDEALSFVDNQTVIAILERIKKDYSHMAVLIISHNSQAIKYADKVVYMKQDSSVLEDKHNNLLKNPDYRKLFNIEQTEI